jgi:uncharacterized protein
MIAPPMAEQDLDPVAAVPAVVPSAPIDAPAAVVPAAEKPAPRMRAWHGVIALIVGGAGGQVAGAVVGAIAVGVLIVVGGHDPTQVEEIQRLAMTMPVIGPSVIATGLTMILGACMAPLIARVPLREGLGIKGAPWPVFIAAPIGINALGPTSDLFRRAMQYIAPDLTLGALEQIDEIARSAPLFVMIPLLAFMPGISEELVFRGAFQRSIANKWVAMVLSALFFAAVHLDPQHVVAVVPLGFYLAWLGQRTGSVLVPITAHIANNAMAVTAVVVWGSSEEATPSESFAWVVGGWLVAAICITVVWWSTRPKPKPPIPQF